jgi:hypothetical protein
MRRLLVPLTLGAAVALLVAGVASAGGPNPPKIVTASPITRQQATLKPGTKVSASSLFGARTFVNAKDGFGLASVGQAQYSAATTDGGASWQTDSPALHVDAAQAPLSVLFVGAASKRVIYAYGGGEAVDVSGDGGKHWWRAFLGDVVDAVVPGVGGLDAFVQKAVGTSSTKTVNWTYVSRDGGHHWHYTTAFVGG